MSVAPDDFARVMLVSAQPNINFAGIGRAGNVKHGGCSGSHRRSLTACFGTDRRHGGPCGELRDRADAQGFNHQRLLEPIGNIQPTAAEVNDDVALEKPKNGRVGFKQSKT